MFSNNPIIHRTTIDKTTKTDTNTNMLITAGQKALPIKHAITAEEKRITALNQALQMVRQNIINTYKITDPKQISDCIFSITGMKI